MPAAALMAATGGAQAGEGEREWAGELLWEVVVCSIWEGGGRRGELHGAQAKPTAMAGGGKLRRTGTSSIRLRDGKRVEREVGNACCAS